MIKSHKTQPPFVWPEPSVLEQIRTYEQAPPFGDLALTSHSLFGIVSAITERGVDTLKVWLENNPDLRVRLILMIYPTCTTRQSDLARLLQVVESASDRVFVHVRPLERVADRGTNALCFLTSDSDLVHIVTGPSEDLGLNPRQEGQVNFVWRADVMLVESFRRYFDWLWVNSRAITDKGVSLIPDLVLPRGSEEGARLWQAYLSNYADTSESGDMPQVIAGMDPVTSDVKIRSEAKEEALSPTEELGLSKLDPLTEQVARLYEKGALVSIDKLSRIPPLDAPLDPRLFGDSSELHRGNVTRRVSMRVSVIDKKTLKEIDKRRQGMRTLLNKFTFGLADNMRWMPTTARELFESELKRVNEEGHKLISDLLKGDVDAYISGKRSMLVDDINAMYMELGGQGQVTKEVIDRVLESLKERLSKTLSGNFLPKLSYSVISFNCTSNDLVSPWGQAFSLLADITAFPRKALADSFFFRGLKVPEDDLIEAMNVADDALCRDLRARGIKGRCEEELDLLSRIENASMEARDRCELIWLILKGDSIQKIEGIFKQKEAS